MFQTIKALVLREVKYRDADKLLTVLSAEAGKLTVTARGALRKRCPFAAAAQILCYSEMMLVEAGGKWLIREAEPIEQFLPLREELEKLALGCYFAEVLETVGDADSVNPELLRLGLNSLYALGMEKYAPEHIKAAFELRAVCMAGFLPLLDGPDEFFSLTGGRVHGAGQFPGSPGQSLPLDEASCAAMRYIVSAPLKRLFSFAIPRESEARLRRVCEAYLCEKLERNFGTLRYWQNVRGPQGASNPAKRTNFGQTEPDYGSL